MNFLSDLISVISKVTPGMLIRGNAGRLQTGIISALNSGEALVDGRLDPNKVVHVIVKQLKLKGRLGDVVEAGLHGVADNIVAQYRSEATPEQIERISKRIVLRLSAIR